VSLGLLLILIGLVIAVAVHGLLGVLLVIVGIVLLATGAY
jgi:hypothetical protein